MKKIVIVLNNMEVGGVQKSLYNLLWTIRGQYDITLCLFQTKGIYFSQLPPDVKTKQVKGPFRHLGLGQGECVGTQKLIRGALALTARIFGRPAAIKLMLVGEKYLPGEYDCAIAFLQNGRIESFYGGVQDYVLHRIKAAKKIAFLHCDYGRCGANHPKNNNLLRQFDQIAACSDGCRESVEKIMPELKDKCVTIRNCHRIEEIRVLADSDSVEYDSNYQNVVMVSRLAHEKGIERAIAAVAKCWEKGIKTRLHIVGDGNMRSVLENMTVERGLAEQVFFYGEQKNPYRYMKNADLFLMTSYHEAAPMVLEEARCIGLPVLTVENTSSHEMVTMHAAGWVCDNSQEALEASLIRILKDREGRDALRKKLRRCNMDNETALRQLQRIIEGYDEN